MIAKHECSKDSLRRSAPTGDTYFRDFALIADDRSHALSVLQSGGQRDDAFFDSLALK